MTRKFLFLLAPSALVAMAFAANAPANPKGAPWLSLEIPANPLDASTRGAVALVHAYYHENHARFPASGKAEGLVEGKRRTIDLSFDETSRAGVYALRPQWPAEGDWMLRLSVNSGGAGPTLLVELGPNGGIDEVEFYGRKAKVLALRSVRLADGNVDAARIDAALRSLALRSSED